VIEDLEGEKIVARRRGLTVNSCVSAVREADETPSFRSLPAGDKVDIIEGNKVCRAEKGQDLKAACVR
jgi:hypothetical protein